MGHGAATATGADDDDIILIGHTEILYVKENPESGGLLSVV